MIFLHSALTPPAEVQQALQTIPLDQAVSAVLAAYDLQDEPVELPNPRVGSKDRAALRWLLSASKDAWTKNPFPKGSGSFKEAERVGNICQNNAVEALAGLAKGPKPSLAGSYMALWRWGRAQVRESRFSKEQRWRWEDLLTLESAPLLFRQYALRHALCFALAENDESRLMGLKQRCGSQFASTFKGFQAAFALLGSPSPRFLFWSLPDIQAMEGPLDQLKMRRFWVMPALGPGLSAVPKDVLWIVPSKDGLQPENEPSLEEISRKEAQDLAEHFRAAGRKALFAPSRVAMEKYMLVYFPIFIELDETGRIQSVRMGEAAPKTP